MSELPPALGSEASRAPNSPLEPTAPGSLSAASEMKLSSFENSTVPSSASGTVSAVNFHGASGDFVGVPGRIFVTTAWMYNPLGRNVDVLRCAWVIGGVVPGCVSTKT